MVTFPAQGKLRLAESAPRRVPRPPLRKRAVSHPLPRLGFACGIFTAGTRVVYPNFHAGCVLFPTHLEER